MKVKKTYSIDKQLARTVRKLAFDQEVSASSLVEEALQDLINKPGNKEEAA